MNKNAKYCHKLINKIKYMELQAIQSRVFEVRGFRVMTDFHLAEMYGVENRMLKQAVRRNMDRFPADFMFELTKEEATELISIGVSQFVIPTKYNIGVSRPFVFTEQGVAMLSTVLKSKTAIQMNILIMRAFVKLRELTTGYAELKQQLEEYQLDTNIQIAEILDIVNEMAAQQKAIYKPINHVVGFKA
jgi:hypothetical protein